MMEEEAEPVRHCDLTWAKVVAFFFAKKKGNCDLSRCCDSLHQKKQGSLLVFAPLGPFGATSEQQGLRRASFACPSSHLQSGNHGLGRCRRIRVQIHELGEWL
jgi:hypothetical protein